MTWLLRILAWVGLPSWVAPLLIVGLVASALGGAYLKGRMDSSAVCRERELRAVIAAMERDQKIASDAAKRSAETIRNLEEAAKRDDEEIAKYAEELKKRPDRCDITPADTDRLLRYPKR